MAADRRTGAETHLAARMNEPAYRAAYDTAKRRIAQVDALVQALDERRARLGMTKAELARRAELAPEAVRRLFSVDAPNPTISTLIALADALDLEVMPRPRRATSPPK
jgi:DNA-binding phage protein